MGKSEGAAVISTGNAWNVDAAIVVEYPKGSPLVWQDPGQVSGAVCLYKSRLPAEVPLKALSEGVSLEEIGAAWPTAAPEEMRGLLELSGHLIESLAQEEGGQ